VGASTAGPLAPTTPNDARRCALARAFERATGFACLVFGWWLYLDEGMLALALPESAQDFQRRYDGAGGRWQVLPFAFDLDVPEPAAGV
jgi:hypothetical protein